MNKVMTVILTLVLSSFVSVGLLHADGKETFDKSCKTCHGADGKGSAAMATGMKIDPLLLDLTKAATKGKPDADLVKVVTEGKAGTSMMGFGKKLDAAQIQEVVTFIKGL